MPTAAKPPAKGLAKRKRPRKVVATKAAASGKAIAKRQPKSAAGPASSRKAGAASGSHGSDVAHDKALFDALDAISDRLETKLETWDTDLDVVEERLSRSRSARHVEAAE